MYYFYIIAREGGIARASETLRLGQPTLSAQLKQFEESLGVLLFDRSSRSLKLTESGQSAYEYAKEIFKLSAEMIEVLNDKTSDNIKHLQIGALDSVPKDVIAQIVEKAYQNQKCTISIFEGKSEELLSQLLDHKIDLIVTNYSLNSHQEINLFSKSIARLPVSIYGSEKFKHLKKGFPQSINEKPFILPTQHSKLRSDLNHYFKVNQIKPLTITETQDTSLQKTLTLNSFGLAPLSENYDLNHSKTLYKIGTLKGVYEEIWLVTAHRKFENPMAAALMKSYSLKKND